MPQFKPRFNTQSPIRSKKPSQPSSPGFFSFLTCLSSKKKRVS